MAASVTPSRAAVSLIVTLSAPLSRTCPPHVHPTVTDQRSNLRWVSHGAQYVGVNGLVTRTCWALLQGVKVTWMRSYQRWPPTGRARDEHREAREKTRLEDRKSVV